jgi:NADH:ubiquinone reductase (H+-translocating)
MAESLPTAEERAPWLTFAVTGAGPTGVELAGQIRELAMRTIAREYRSIDPREARVLLFDGLDAPVPEFGEKLSAKAAHLLARLGVELHMGVLVTNIDATGLETKSKDGTVTRYDARTVLWTAGVHAVPFVDELAGRLGAEQDRGGRIQVRPYLTVPNHDNIWVVGDIMALNGLPGVAEVAMQGGIHAGREIRSSRTVTPVPSANSAARLRASTQLSCCACGKVPARDRRPARSGQDNRSSPSP